MNLICSSSLSAYGVHFLVSFPNVWTSDAHPVSLDFVDFVLQSFETWILVQLSQLLLPRFTWPTETLYCSFQTITHINFLVPSDYLCAKIFFEIFILATVFKIIVSNSFSLFTACWGQVHSLYVLRFCSTPHLQIFDWNYLGNFTPPPFAIYMPTHPILFNLIVLII